MQFHIIRDSNQHNIHLEKFVITAFFDYPNPGRVTSFVEVCSSTGGAFRLQITKKTEISIVNNFYQDGEACKRLYTQYKAGNGGEHSQEVGGKMLEVVPRKCGIFEVASASNRSHLEASYKIDFGAPPVAGKSWGAWIRWEQDSGFTLEGNSFSNVKIEYSVEEIIIDNFYFFLVQPPDYRTNGSSYEISSIKQSLIDSTNYIIQDAVFESEIPTSFPVFAAWKDIFHGRKFLRNRKAISLMNGQQVTISFTSISEKLSLRMLIFSYIAGIGFAIFAGLLTNGIYIYLNGLQDQNMGETIKVILLIAGIVGTIISGLYGWYILKKVR